MLTMSACVRRILTSALSAIHISAASATALTLLRHPDHAIVHLQPSNFLPHCQATRIQPPATAVAILVGMHAACNLAREARNKTATDGFLTKRKTYNQCETLMPIEIWIQMIVKLHTQK